MRRPKILVVGSMNMDIYIYDVPRIPAIGESVMCGNYAYATGGKGSNQALACALQGANAVMVGRVGKDRNGYALEERLKGIGVDTSHMIFDEEAQTGLAIMNVTKEGKYFCCVALGANTKICPQDVEAAFVNEEYDMLVMQLEIPLETVYRTYEMASRRKIPVFLDAGPAMSIPLDRLKGIFVISPNETETEALTGIKVDTLERIEMAGKQLYDRVNPKYVILKLGSRGAYLYDGEQGKLIPGFKVNAIDSTAAGDTFGAAIAVQLCKGKSIEDAICFGHAAAGICVSRKGAHPSIPTEKEVVRFLQQRL